MEYLDIYDELGNYLGKEDRKIVHKEALWHNTVHCWLYDNDGNVFFQVRKEEGTLYTTASGHVQAGETIKMGFKREIEEEIGIPIEQENATLVDVVKFSMDRENKDGTFFRDRAFANVYVYEFSGNYDEFDFDENELLSLVLVNAKEALEVLKNESGSLKGKVITKSLNGNIVTEKEIKFEDFLINKGETGIGKYGDVLNKIIELTNKDIN